MRTKFFVEYPLCLSFEMALAWLKAGHEIWQEDSGNFPSCGGFDKGCFEENFPDKEVDYTNDLHLVPKNKIEVEVERFPKIGDKVVAIEDINSYVCQGCLEIINSVKDEKIGLVNLEGLWNVENFLYADNITFASKGITDEQKQATAEHLKKYGVTV